jgi:hypothetical protein
MNGTPHETPVPDAPDFGVSHDEDNVKELIAFYREHNPEQATEKHAREVLDYFYLDKVISMCLERYGSAPRLLSPEQLQQQRQQANGVSKRRKEAPHRRLCDCYLRMGPYCDRLAKDNRFVAIVFIGIGIAAINDGLQTYARFQDSKFLSTLDFSLLMVFTIEMLAKIIACGAAPWRYWIGYEELRWKEIQIMLALREIDDDDDDSDDDDEEKDGIELNRWWNSFDFTIVMICYAGLFMGGGTSIGFLRMLRLMRIVRLLKFWENLQSIVRGLAGGLKASGSILGLMSFIMFLFGTMGVTMFGDNDPLHFRNLASATITLYQMSNMEWLEVARINMHGCDTDNDYYTIVFDEDVKTSDPELYAAATSAAFEEQYHALNLFNERRMKAQLLSDVYSEPNNASAAAFMAEEEIVAGYTVMQRGEFWCIPQKNVVMGALYFISFIVVTALVMTTLFTGAVSLSMTFAVREIQEAQMIVLRAQAAERAKVWILYN